MLFETTFVSREDAEWLRVVLKLRHGTGHAWFDDLELAPVAPVSRSDANSVRRFPADDGFTLQAMWTPAQWSRRRHLADVDGGLFPLGEITISELRADTMTTRRERPRESTDTRRRADCRRDQGHTPTPTDARDAVRIALSMGVSLHEIERFLDYLDAANDAVDESSED